MDYFQQSIDSYLRRRQIAIVKINPRTKKRLVECAIEYGRVVISSRILSYRVLLPGRDPEALIIGVRFLFLFGSVSASHLDNPA